MEKAFKLVFILSFFVFGFLIIGLFLLVLKILLIFFPSLHILGLTIN